MKHNDNKLPDLLKRLMELPKAQRFYTIGEGRYTVLFKRMRKLGPTRLASSVALSPDCYEGTLYIYDGESYERSPVYTINSEGILGLNGTKAAVVEQLTHIDDIVNKVLKSALVMEGMK